MAVNPKRPKRSLEKNDVDLDIMSAAKWNDATGADKVIIVEPVVKKATVADEIVGAGRLVKVTGTSYTLKLLGKAYGAGNTYQKGDVATQAGDVYMATQDNITGAFDAAKWRKVAADTIGPVTVSAGAVVSTGRWHNAIGQAGFLVDDDSFISHQRVRD